MGDARDRFWAKLEALRLELSPALYSEVKTLAQAAFEEADAVEVGPDPNLKPKSAEELVEDLGRVLHKGKQRFIGVDVADKPSKTVPVVIDSLPHYTEVADNTDPPWREKISKAELERARIDPVYFNRRFLGDLEATGRLDQVRSEGFVRAVEDEVADFRYAVLRVNRVYTNGPHAGQFGERLEDNRARANRIELTFSTRDHHEAIDKDHLYRHDPEAGVVRYVFEMSEEYWTPLPSGWQRTRPDPVDMNAPQRPGRVKWETPAGGWIYWERVDEGRFMVDADGIPRFEYRGATQDALDALRQWLGEPLPVNLENE